MTSETKPTVAITTSQFVDGPGNTIDAADFTIPFGEVEDLLDFLGQVSVTASDTNIKHLNDALNDGGDITFTVTSAGGNERIQATINAASVGTPELAANSVTSAKLAADSVGADEIDETAQIEVNRLTADDTFGVRVLRPGGGTAGMQFGSTAGNNRTLEWGTIDGAGVFNRRWLMNANGEAETGSNAGSDFELQSRTDAGGFVGVALKITRSSRNARFYADMQIDGALSKGSGTFEIGHQTREGYSLRHEMVEGPRADLIYRGRATLSLGKATVDLDAECNDTGGMSAGTFEWLTQNPQVFVSNNETWDRVRGSVSGATLTIECENASSAATVEWMVVAERADEVIKDAEYTDADGRVICEHENPPLDMAEVQAAMAQIETVYADGTPKSAEVLKEERLRMWKQTVRSKGKYPVRGPIKHPQTGRPVEVIPPGLRKKQV